MLNKKKKFSCCFLHAVCRHRGGAVMAGEVERERGKERRSIVYEDRRCARYRFIHTYTYRKHTLKRAHARILHTHRFVFIQLCPKIACKATFQEEVLEGSLASVRDSAKPYGKESK